MVLFKIFIYLRRIIKHKLTLTIDTCNKISIHNVFDITEEHVILNKAIWSRRYINRYIHHSAICVLFKFT